MVDPNGIRPKLDLLALESEIQDTVRRLKALQEVMMAWSSNKGLDSDQVAILHTLINDIEDGAVRTEKLFDREDVPNRRAA